MPLPTIPYQTVQAEVDFSRPHKGILAKYSQNVAVTDGKLHPTPKFCRVLPQEVFAAFQLPDGNFIYTCPSGVYLTVTDGDIQICPLQLNSPTFLHCSKQQTTVFSQVGVGTFCYNHASGQTVQSGVGMDSLAFLKERVFGISGNTLYFTPRNDFSRLEYLTLSEEVVGLAEVCGELAVVGTSIFKVQFDDVESKTQVTRVYSGIKATPKTVVAVGNKVVFGADGLYCYSQNKVEKFSDVVATQISVGDCLWVATKKSLWQFDGLKPRAQHDIAVQNLCGNTVVSNGIALQQGSDTSTGLWRSVTLDFGNPFVKKQFRYFTVDATKGVEVHIITDTDRQIYHTEGGCQKVNIRGGFYRCKVELHLDCDLQLSKFSLCCQMPKSEVKYANR